MPSIAQIVEELVLEQPFLADALQRGLISYGALADELLPRAQRETKREVKHAAVMMALRRFADRLETQEPATPSFTGANVTIRSNLFEITVANTKRAFEAVHAFRERIRHDQGELLTVTQGLYELTIISNKQHLPALKEALQDETVKNVTEDLSLLTVRIPDDALETPGYFYTLTKAFAWESINIIEIVSTLTEMTFALNDRDIPRAYKLVKGVLVPAGKR